MKTSTSSVTVQIQDPTLNEKELEQFTLNLYNTFKRIGIERIPIPEKPKEKGGRWLTGQLKMAESEVDQQKLSTIKANIEARYSNYQVQEFHDQDGNVTMLQISPRPSIQKQAPSRGNVK